MTGEDWQKSVIKGEIYQRDSEGRGMRGERDERREKLAETKKKWMT